MSDGKIEAGPHEVQMHWEQILVRPEAVPKQTAGGLHIPDTVELEIDNMRTGLVVAVGPGLRNGAGEYLGCATKAGDRAVYHKNVGQAMVLDDLPYLVMGDRDVRMTIGKGVTVSKIMARVPATN